MDDRILLLEQINKCIKFVDKNLIQFDKGGQGSIFKLEQKDCGLAVVKTYNDIKTKYSKEAMNAEVNALLMVKKIIPKMCPNFIYLYDYDYDKKRILLEYADGDLLKLFKTTILDKNILKGIIFQILIGVYALTKLNLIHNDFKYDNIFYKKTTQTHLCYIINGVKYIIPTYGYLVLIADFGQSKLRTSSDKNGEMYYYTLIRPVMYYLIKLITPNLNNISDVIQFVEPKYKQLMMNKINILPEGKKRTHRRTLKYLYFGLKFGYIKYETIYNFVINNKNNLDKELFNEFMNTKLHQFDNMLDFLNKVFHYNSNILKIIENEFNDIIITKPQIMSNNCYNLDLIK
jgi:serine/threonine protein kinase